MQAKLMNGVYYEVVGGISEDYIKEVSKCDYTDKEITLKAADEERAAYKNTYKDGKRIKSSKLYDPYGDAFFIVGDDRLHYEPLPYEMRFKYQMLGRLKSDCEYFLGNGNGYEGHLWAGSVEEQIAEMRKRWNEFEDDEKPEWLTMEQINEYEKNMLDVREQVRKIKEAMPPGTSYSLRIERSDNKCDVKIADGAWLER